ncbi:hypothetical protein GCM10025789_09010 [Tessaracoccus lubricantis]|uniref:PKD domain-containing protein n=1 Tax=Tessaracoccus lubricantis TaxID=545543 RepID=A0ABP9F4R3_9ACTN
MLRLSLAVVVALLFVSVPAPPANAEPEASCVRRGLTGTCLEWLQLGGSQTGEGASIERPREERAAPGSARACTWQGKAIDCVTSLGVWSDLASSWCRRSEPQPPASDPAWEGKTTGAVYLCVRPAGDLVPDPGMVSTRWLPVAPGVVEVDPRAVALRLLARLDLEAVELGMFPRGDNDVRLSFVGWQNWMWAESPSQRQWGPVTASDSGSGVMVRLRAEVDRVEWDMGDGTVLTCGKGTPWSATRTQGGRNVASPDCGHVYEAMGSYTVTATSHWDVQWSGAGRSGTLPFTLSRSSEYLVGEYQAVNTGR